MLTPTKRSAVKITGVIFSIHVDDDGANHWVVTAGEIYFLRDCSWIPGLLFQEQVKLLLLTTMCVF